MKNLLLLFLIFSSSAFSQSADEEILQNIANAVDLLHADTLNEGDLTAYVKKVNGRPEMTCAFAQYLNSDKGLARCYVTFDIKSQFTDEPESSSNKCFLIHIYDLKTFKITGRVEILSRICMKNLSH
jgi:hypothetical protein